MSLKFDETVKAAIAEEKTIRFRTGKDEPVKDQTEGKKISITIEGKTMNYTVPVGKVTNFRAILIERSV